MSNWDDDEWEDSSNPAPSSVPSLHSNTANWDDEDESEEEETAVLKKPSAPMKPSKMRALALKQKEEEENRKAAERAKAHEKLMQEMTPIERKMEQQRIVEESDMQNAKDMFMVSDGNAAMAPPAEPTIENYKPVSEEDFKKFAEMIGKRCRQFNTDPRRTGRYVDFMKELYRSVTADLGADDAKSLATFAGLVSNEKRDDLKKSRGFKKKTNKKTSVRVDNAEDMRDDRYDDFADDFM